MTTEDMKKYATFCVLGIVLVLGLVGTFVPDAREYLSNLTKIILALVPGLN